MKKINLLGAAAIIAASPTLQAANFLADESGNWATGSRWDSGSAPTAAQDAFVRSGTQHVFVTLNGMVANRLTLGQSASQATLTIQSGSLEMAGEGSNFQGALYYAWGGTGTTSGIINLQGGSLTAITMGVNVNSAGDIARLNITGGALSVTGNYSSGGFSGAESSINIVGDAATSLVIGGTSNFNDHSTLSFDFNGGTSVSLWQTNTLNIGSNATLEVIANSSMIAGSTYDLASFNTLAGSYDGNYTVTGLSAGLMGTVEYDSGSMYLNVVAVPEPASAALMSIGGLSFLLKRRR